MERGTALYADPAFWLFCAVNSVRLLPLRPSRRTCLFAGLKCIFD
ncbi:MAG: hypothetical protein HSCHL_0657 [Hydrogenibacillus schlegelii]|uniref:Uncharacterized protein n=1 Tax=Hydrogenibacillus schlegelii TaxID=1484 RepID=A0A2T5G3G5_HYDSH|nr:MAG: hypothetical protein HSCHL_0657 [Hydrogenibacillus schlegelii]